MGVAPTSTFPGVNSAPTVVSVLAHEQMCGGCQMNFNEKLITASRKNKSLLCIGLDPDPELMPGKVGIFKFNKAIIDATSDLVCAYKLNLAFYEALGDEGLDALKRTIKYIPSNIPVIGDAKRGDIGNTAKAYAGLSLITLTSMPLR